MNARRSGDAIAYLEVTLNPANDLKFERIINVPKRGIGDSTVRGASSSWRALAPSRFMPPRAKSSTARSSPAKPQALADLIATFERWRAQVTGMKHTELAGADFDESGYTQMWQHDRSPQQARLENLKELVRFMHEFETLTGLPEHVSLVMDADGTEAGDRVSLMTLHAAKGLEFEVVFLPRLGGGPVSASAQPQ